MSIKRFPVHVVRMAAAATFIVAGIQIAAGQGRGRGGTPPVAYDDYTGYTKLWDGATFANWSGESDVWTIENGMLHADTVKTPGQHHIYYMGPNAVMKDFDLKVEFKISAAGANGGIQYRSRLLHVAHGGSIQDPLGKPLPAAAGITTVQHAVEAGLTTLGGGGGGARGRGGAPGAAPGPAAAPRAGAAPASPAPPTAARGAAAPAAPAAPTATGPCTTAGGPPPTAGPNIPLTSGNPWQVSGYQFDLDSNNQYTGQLYEGQGRSIVTAPGTITELLPGRATCIGVITDTPSAFVKPHLGLDGEWQQVQIIARGNTLVHIINGHVISVSIDDNPDFRALQGILSLQLEGSGQIWYRNVYVKFLDK